MVLHTNFVCELKIRVEKKMNLLVLRLRPRDSSIYTIADYRNKKTRQVAFCNLQKGIGNSSDLQIADCKTQKIIRNGQR